MSEFWAPYKFTTEDGVDIFEGDSYWCVNTAPHLWSLFEQTAKERTMLNKTVRAFSTEEGAFLRGQVQMEEKMDLFPQDVAAETITPLKQTPEKTDSTREE